MFYDERMAGHKGSRNHPERPERIISIYTEIKEQNLLENCHIILADQIDLPNEKELSVVHSSSHISKIMATKERCEGGGMVYFSNDTYANEFSSTAAALAIGGLWEITKKGENIDCRDSCSGHA